jgi:hypothetical protein
LVSAKGPSVTDSRPSRTRTVMAASTCSSAWARMSWPLARSSSLLAAVSSISASISRCDMPLTRASSA